jgi:nuclear transport factor 2 (NTF2) superfamily protein
MTDIRNAVTTPIGPLLRPPFDARTARLKVKAAEETWNTCDAERVVLSHSLDTVWRMGDEILCGREEVAAYLRRRWEQELDYRVANELWAFMGNRISVRVESEWRDVDQCWYRGLANEHWEFDESGLVRLRDASIDRMLISRAERRLTTRPIRRTRA